MTKLWHITTDENITLCNLDIPEDITHTPVIESSTNLCKKCEYINEHTFFTYRRYVNLTGQKKPSSEHGGKRQGSGPHTNEYHGKQDYCRVGITLPPELCEWVNEMQMEGEALSHCYAKLLGYAQTKLHQEYLEMKTEEDWQQYQKSIHDAVDKRNKCE